MIYQSKGFLKIIKGWRLLATIDPNIINYYKYLAQGWGIPILTGSKNGPHISIVQGEKPRNIKLWNSLKGKSIDFSYSNILYTDSYHTWVFVESKQMSQLRIDLGLKPEPFHPFHITIGRLKYGIDHLDHNPRPKGQRNEVFKL